MAPATMSAGMPPALAIIMSTSPMVPTVPNDVPKRPLTRAGNRKAHTTKSDGSRKLSPTDMMVGIVPDACHMEVSQPISKKIWMTIEAEKAPFFEKSISVDQS